MPRAWRLALKLGCRAVIVMPTTTPQVKIDAVKALGDDVVLNGIPTPMPMRLRFKHRRTASAFVHPFDDRT
jgi:threonine dehydratase